MSSSVIASLLPFLVIGLVLFVLHARSEGKTAALKSLARSFRVAFAGLAGLLGTVLASTVFVVIAVAALAVILAVIKALWAVV